VEPRLDDFTLASTKFDLENKLKDFESKLCELSPFSTSPVEFKALSCEDLNPTSSFFSEQASSEKDLEPTPKLSNHRQRVQSTMEVRGSRDQGAPLQNK